MVMSIWALETEREREGDRDRETDRQTWELETLRQKTDRQKDRQTDKTGKERALFCCLSIKCFWYLN